MTDTPSKPSVSQAEAEAAVRTLIQWAGDNPDREGLLETPSRVAKSYRELFQGYETDPLSYLEKTFEETGGYDQLVVLKDIRFVSFCEHHMLPVVGKAHVAYLPTDRVVGISKLARVVRGFAHLALNAAEFTLATGELEPEALRRELFTLAAERGGYGEPQAREVPVR